MAISSPLLETSIEGAKGVIINITARWICGLEEVDLASQIVHDAAPIPMQTSSGVYLLWR